MRFLSSLVVVALLGFAVASPLAAVDEQPANEERAVGALRPYGMQQTGASFEARQARPRPFSTGNTASSSTESKMKRDGDEPQANALYRGRMWKKDEVGERDVEESYARPRPYKRDGDQPQANALYRGRMWKKDEVEERDVEESYARPRPHKRDVEQSYSRPRPFKRDGEQDGEQ